MKRTLALLSALIFAGTSTACSKGSSESSSEVTTSKTAEALCSLSSADIQMADDFDEIICTDKSNTRFLIFGKTSGGDHSLYITDTSFSEKTAFTFKPRENENVRSAALMPFGKTAVLTTDDTNTYINVLDKDGSVEKILEPGKVISPEDTFTQLLCTDDGFYINVSRHTLAFIDKDGNYSGDIDTGRRNVCGVTSDNEGAPCALLSEDSKLYLCRLSGTSVESEISCGELATYTEAICAGMGEYTIAVVVTSGLYALKDGEWLKIADFSENDFSTNEIMDIEMTADSEFSAVINSDSGGYDMRLLTQRDISEIKAKKVIKVAKMVGGNIDPYSDFIKKYMSENDDYKIEFVDYADGVDDPDQRYESLKLDIISGNAPDIIQFGYGAAPLSFSSPESIFVDLYDMLEKDDELSKTDFVDGFLENLETNGKLLNIMPTFTVSSLLIKDKFANGLTTWNYDQFEEIVENMPEDMDVLLDARNHSKFEMFRKLIDCSAFIDSEKAECSFDSPEFIRTIKLINDKKIGLTAKEIESLPQSAHTTSYSDYAYALRKDEVLLHDADFISWNDFKVYEQVYSGEPATFIGYPNEKGETAYGGGGYGYGIMANSENIDAAWDFLKYYLFDEDSEFRHGFSPLKDRLKESLDYECVLHTYTDPETGEEKNGDIFSLQTPGGVDMVDFELEPFTPEQAEKYEALILDSLKSKRAVDGEVWNILEDELNAYFEGGCSAEDAAKMIQNRAEIYLSEHYG